MKSLVYYIFPMLFLACNTSSHREQVPYVEDEFSVACRNHYNSFSYLRVNLDTTFFLRTNNEIELSVYTNREEVEVSFHAEKEILSIEKEEGEFNYTIHPVDSGKVWVLIESVKADGERDYFYFNLKIDPAEDNFTCIEVDETVEVSDRSLEEKIIERLQGLPTPHLGDRVALFYHWFRDGSWTVYAADEEEASATGTFLRFEKMFFAKTDAGDFRYDVVEYGDEPEMPTLSCITDLTKYFRNIFPEDEISEVSMKYVFTKD